MVIRSSRSVADGDGEPGRNLSRSFTVRGSSPRPRDSSRQGLQVRARSHDKSRRGRAAQRFSPCEQLIAVADGTALDGRQVGAGARLERARRRSIRRPRCGGGARRGGWGRFTWVPMQLPRAMSDGDAHPASRQLLGDQSVLEDAEAHAAELAADHRAEVAHRPDAAEELARDVRFLVVELVGEREDFLHREFASGRLDGEAFVGEVDAHAESRFFATRLERL